MGHLYVRETGVVFVDPPTVPGLLEAARRLGKLEAVLLTEQNHTRASRFIAKRAGIRVYLPETNPEAVEPWETARVKQIGDFEVCKAGDGSVKHSAINPEACGFFVLGWVSDGKSGEV